MVLLEVIDGGKSTPKAKSCRGHWKWPRPWLPLLTRNAQLFVVATLPAGVETSPPVCREAPTECLGCGPGCQGRAGRAAGTAEVLTPTSPSPAVRSNSPAGPASGRQGQPRSPQNTSAQHCAWHAFLNERPLITTSPNADSIQMPFLIASGLIAFCFSDFRSITCALREKKENNYNDDFLTP